VTSTIYIVDYMTRPIGGILVIPACLGAVRLWREERREVVLFALVPMLLALVAAVARCYPYTGARTMIFAMPALVVLIAAGIEPIVEIARVRRAIGTLAIAIGSVALVATLGLSLYRVAAPWSRADTFGASAYVLARRQPNEPVTANHWEYNYYFRHLGASFYSDLQLLDAAERPARFWIVMTAGNAGDRRAVLDRADAWQVVDQHEFENSTVFLLSRKEL
jgi:hypothetical protein